MKNEATTAMRTAMQKPIKPDRMITRAMLVSDDGNRQIYLGDNGRTYDLKGGTRNDNAKVGTYGNIIYRVTSNTGLFIFQK